MVYRDKKGYAVNEDGGKIIYVYKDHNGKVVVERAKYTAALVINSLPDMRAAYPIERLSDAILLS
jgi:hypothetical protein